MGINIIEGNILNSEKDIIVHQVNCQGVMGGGLAKQIVMKYPEVPKEYKKYWTKQMKKLNYTSELLGEVYYADTFDEKIIVNVFGQDHIRKSRWDKAIYTIDSALIKGIENVRDKARQLNLSVAMPTYIGCGLAGGDWNSVKPQIEKVFEGSGVEVTFYHYR